MAQTVALPNTIFRTSFRTTFAAIPALSYKSARLHVSGSGQVEQSIYKYILRYSRRQQIIVTLLAVVSFPFLYAFYELPKRIVNQAIEGKGTTFPVDLAGFLLTRSPTCFCSAACSLFSYSSTRHSNTSSMSIVA